MRRAQCEMNGPAGPVVVGAEQVRKYLGKGFTVIRGGKTTVALDSNDMPVFDEAAGDFKMARAPAPPSPPPRPPSTPSFGSDED